MIGLLKVKKFTPHSENWVEGHGEEWLLLNFEDCRWLQSVCTLIINCDIAQAVAFLHSNRIVHRDLSSNNVLMIGAGVRAKVTDFGMSKLVSLNSRKTPLTKCPGIPEYMSPEALLDPPIYTEKLDCFQVGVLMIQIITRKFPNPGPSMNRVRDERYPTGWINVPVPETERRENHLRLVTATHPMFSLAMDCLKDTDTERPSAQQICHRLSAMKETPQYRQSLEAGEGGERHTQQILERVEEELRQLQCELREKDALICQLQQSQQFASYNCHVSSPGLQSSTANHPTHVIVKVMSTTRPCTLQHNITAELECVSIATPTSGSKWPWTKKPK